MTHPRRTFLVNVLGVLALPLLWHTVTLYQSAQRYALVLPIHCDQPLTVQLDADTGLEYGDSLRFAVSLRASTAEQTLRVNFPTCEIAALALHLRAVGERPAAVRLGNLQLTSEADEALGRDRVVTLPAIGFAPAQQIARFTPAPGGEVQIETIAGGPEAGCLMKFAKPLRLEFNLGAFSLSLGLDLLICALAGAGAWVLWGRRPGVQAAGRKLEAAQVRFCAAATQWGYNRPRTAIWLAGLAGVLISCFPVVFCGKSFVSPNLTLPLLYDHLPTLPGYADARPGNNQLSDVAANMLAHVPYGVVENQALFHDRDWPVWDRYDAGGIPLLGQGQSMLGDPLQWLPILTRSAAWAWDLKFLLAKLLFAAGIGLLVRAGTGHLPSALLLAFASCFISFFIFRLNHSTFFGVCYAPWILYAWLRLARGAGGVRAYALLLLANWMELNSGTAKDACILLLHMNGCGMLIFLWSAETTWAWKRRRLLGLLFAGVCFALISAPLWLTLLDAIAHSWNDYQTPSTHQIQPGALIGLFDDIYYRQFNFGERLYNPGLNFVALLGLGLALARWRTLIRERVFAAVTLSSVPPLAIVFGVAPPGLINRIPFVGNIQHVDSTFTGPLLIFLLLLAGFGFRASWRRRAARGWATDVAVAILAALGLWCAFLGLAQAWQSSNINPAKAMAELKISRFCWIYTSALFAGFAGLPFVARKMGRDGGATLVGYAPLLVLCLGALLWRHALNLPGISFRYVMSPGARVDLSAPSPAVTCILERQRREPGRTMGFGNQLAPGFNTVYGLESPSGPDALQNRYYHELLARSGVQYWNGWYLVADRSLFAGNQKFLDALNVRYYLDSAEPPAPGLTLVGRYDLNVFESATAWPRAFFTDTVLTEDELAGFYQAISRGDGRPFASMTARDLAAAGVALPRDQAAREVAPADDYGLATSATAFHVHAARSGVIVLLEGFPERDAEVSLNGHTVSHFRVNHAFTGVYAPSPGDYLVRIRYWPHLLTAGLWLAALGAVGLAGGAWRLRRETLGQP